MKAETETERAPAGRGLVCFVEGEVLEGKFVNKFSSEVTPVLPLPRMRHVLSERKYPGLYYFSPEGDYIDYVDVTEIPTELPTEPEDKPIWVIDTIDNDFAVAFDLEGYEVFRGVLSVNFLSYANNFRERFELFLKLVYLIKPAANTIDEFVEQFKLDELGTWSIDNLGRSNSAIIKQLENNVLVPQYYYNPETGEEDEWEEPLISFDVLCVEDVIYYNIYGAVVMHLNSVLFYCEDRDVYEQAKKLKKQFAISSAERRWKEYKEGKINETQLHCSIADAMRNVKFREYVKNNELSADLTEYICKKFSEYL